ncbi:aKG-HExxH-type peptide beta-hydroxylase [Dactylosporangium sp. CS-047395]|uniref:aKG-HExxH-type peptide beta-hydroxylase n=1 Tax=Dactylosporangium sp. CS-047395 TaxID=3239936 RepID=UPI003D8B4B54
MHRLPGRTFDAIAAGRFDEPALDALRAAQFSRHLLLIRGLVDAARAHLPERRAAVDGALAVLAEAQRRDPAAFAAVLGYPYVGSWAAFTLRRIAAGAGDAGHHLDQLSAVAAAAAIRAGVPTPVEVPAPGGILHLPTLGTVRGEPGRPVTIEPGQEPAARFGDAWLAVTSLGLMRYNRGVLLDDLHPYRAPTGMPPAARLGPAEREDWGRLYGDAERWLAERSPAAVGLLPLLRVVTPLAGRGGLHGLSATSRYAFGSVVLTPPDGASGFAATLVHELRHGALNALLDLVPLIAADSSRRYYSPWRRDPRPLHGILHGVYAFLGVLEYWRGVGERTGRTGFELARTAAQLAAAIDTLERSGGLLPAGERFVAALRRSLEGDGAVEVAAPAATAARRVIQEHRLAWRLRQLRPDPAAIAALAAGWAAGDLAPGPAPAVTIAESVDPFVERGRTALLAHAAQEPQRSDDALTRWPDLLDGDVALAAGDLALAADRYAARIAEAPDDLDAWSGLAMTSADPIWASPELVYAVHRRLTADGRPADVTDLARWLAPLADG